MDIQNKVKANNIGFTLIEFLILIMIFSIVIFTAARIYINLPVSPETMKAKQDIILIENGMEFYKLDNGFYPTTEQGIAALITMPTTNPKPKHWAQYLKVAPIDPWGEPYHYSNPGKHKNIDIYTYGPSKQPSWWTEVGNWS